MDGSNGMAPRHGLSKDIRSDETGCTNQSKLHGKSSRLKPNVARIAAIDRGTSQTSK